MASAQYTGVTFDETVHSYTDWGLRLKKIEIGLPEEKRDYVDVPGMHGRLDLSEAQNGGVKYDMRDIKITFDARNCSYARWSELVSRIAKDIQGKNKKIILDTDTSFYYYGRCRINTEKTNEVTAEIVIDCYCEPHKYSVTSSDEDWLWDPFSFADGYAYNTADIAIDAEDGWQAVTVWGFEYNPTIKIVSDAAMKVKFGSKTYSIAEGENFMYDIELSSGENELYFQGSGTVTIVHRGGII